MKSTHVIVLACLVAGLPLGARAKERPNIILFMTDDMGMECLGAYGSETYKTPNLDALASQGLKFTHCYSQPLCTPSRVKIMTGRYNFRNYTKFKYLDPSQRTFGHVARSAGYATAIAGKWQLDGSASDDFATKFGFDRYCVWYLNQKHFGSRYLHPRLVQDGKEIGGKGFYGPDLCNDFALEFIEENKEKSFFLYYPMILPHFPFEPTPDSKEWDPKVKKAKKDNRYFVDMVQYADKLVGKVVQKVEDLGLAKNTLIMFTSDNGTMRGLHSQWKGQDYPGGKGRLDNTGTHVPLIVRWDQVVKPGQSTSQLVDFSDFFATVQDVTGGEGPKDYKTDGQSLLGLFQGAEDYRPRSYTFCHYDPKWGTPETGNWVRDQKYKVYGGGMIYGLEQDYFEKTPLAEDVTAKIETIGRLQKVLKGIQAEGSAPPQKFRRAGMPKSK